MSQRNILNRTPHLRRPTLVNILLGSSLTLLCLAMFNSLTKGGGIQDGFEFDSQ